MNPETDYEGLIVSTITGALENVFKRPLNEIHLPDLDFLTVASEYVRAGVEVKAEEAFITALKDQEVMGALHDVITEMKELIYMMEPSEVRQKKNRPAKSDTSRDHEFLTEASQLLNRTFMQNYRAMVVKYPGLLPAQVSLQGISGWLENQSMAVDVIQDPGKLVKTYRERIEAFQSNLDTHYQAIPAEISRQFDGNDFLSPLAIWGIMRLKTHWRNTGAIAGRLKLESLGKQRPEPDYFHPGYWARVEKGVAGEDKMAAYLSHIAQFVGEISASPKVGGMPEMQGALYYVIQQKQQAASTTS